MKKLKYIYLLLIAMLLGFAISSCEDDEVVVGEDDDEVIVGGGSGEMISTTFTVGISAPNVSGDLDVATRAGGDNANIEYAKPENGGRFQNLIVVLTNQEGIIKGVECKNWGDGVGVKEYTAIFPNIQVPATDVTNKKQYKVYAFGNICQEHYEELDDEAKSKINGSYTGWQNFDKHCISLTLKADNVYELDFTPGTTHYSKKNDKEYYVNTTKTGGKEDVVCTGMPVNNSATAMVVKGNTQFNVALKRVCARLQVTFRNFTGKTDYDNYYGDSPKGNRVYVDKFVLKKALTTSTKYFYDGSAPSTAGSVDFDILKALGGSTATNNHIINKIENGEDLVVSMYVFENKKSTARGTDAYQYDLKVDRGKSLGQQVQKLQDDNVYVMWSDNLDPGSYANSENRCLGANDNNILLVSMNDPSKIPYGTGDYGNRVFWHYNGGKFQSCKVDLKTDGCTLSGKYIPYSGGINSNYSTTLGNSYAFTPSSSEFEGFHRFALRTTLGLYMMISKNNLQSRSIVSFKNQKPYFPWVFFAKYIIKNGEAFSTGTGTSKTDIQQIERNGSYELDFSVMPNYNTKQELLVNCVRKQSEITWSETQK